MTPRPAPVSAKLALKDARANAVRTLPRALDCCVGIRLTKRCIGLRSGLHERLQRARRLPFNAALCRAPLAFNQSDQLHQPMGRQYDLWLQL